MFEIPEVTEEFRNRLTGKSEAFIQAAWKYGRLNDALFTAQAGQMILGYCFEKGYCPELTFHSWHQSDILAKNKNGKRYYVIGSYNSCKYILRGIVKVNSRAKRHFYGINGQAGQGTIQVAHIAEEDSVFFSQLYDAYTEFMKY